MKQLEKTEKLGKFLIKTSEPKTDKFLRELNQVAFVIRPSKLTKLFRKHGNFISEILSD